MSFFKKLLGKRDAPIDAQVTAPPRADSHPNTGPDMIRVYDAYGREMFITKEQWRTNVLPGSLESARSDPAKLYGTIVIALQDGFAQDVVAYAEHLQRTDPIPTRGATVLGIVYLQLHRLDEAERVLQECLERHGEDGVVLTNLAKVYAARGDDARVEATLWHALELDPNQDNGMGWYTAIHRDRGGEAGALEAFRRIASISASWRARLWLARDALHRNDLESAISLYEESLVRAKRPVPADLLMQMSGDLGTSGYLEKLLQLVVPHFDPAAHGLQVGNNVIKANLDLGRLDETRRVLDQLYAQNRPDWRQQLNFWDTELAKARLQTKSADPAHQAAISMLSIEGPLWMRNGSPFAALLAAKRPGAPRVGIFGSTALLAHPPPRAVVQLSDRPGRLSRALPVVLAEQVHLASTAVGIALIPWAQGQGFALFGKPYEDERLCELVRKGDSALMFVANTLVDATGETWSVALRLLRASDAVCVASAEARAPMTDPARAVETLSLDLMRILTDQDVEPIPVPPWYRRPGGADGSDYLLRLEQQLAVSCRHLGFLQGGALSGEHEILDGALQLCVRDPDNPTVRMLFAQTLREMKKVRPEILSEYKEKADLLQREHPLAGDVGKHIGTALSEAFAA